MKANFALSLSFDGLRLLHRAAGGWRHVGEVSLEDPDLAGSLAAMRSTALGLEPSGLRTKLILPSSQIKYTSIHTADTAPQDLHQIAEAALDGMTPYAVSELAFDLSPDGAQTHIAAVAKETLLEAEAFAVEHRFNPISFVAVPDEDPFLGEPFFGATSHAQNLLRPGEDVEPDGIAVVVIGDIPPAPRETITSAAEPSASPHDLTGYELPQEAELSEVAGSVDTVEAPESYAPAPALGGVTRQDDPALAGGILAGSLPGAEPLDTVGAATMSEATASFVSRRGRRSGGDVAPEAVFVPQAPEPILTAPASVETPYEDTVPVAPFGTDGAQHPDQAIATRRQRPLALILTGLLILFLAAVGAWASIFLEDGVSGFFKSPAPEHQIAIDALPQITDPQDDAPDSMTTAALSEDGPDQTLLPEALAEPDPIVGFDPVQAEAQYAVTGIWVIPPDVPRAPALLGLDNLYVTSIDGANLSFDAVALEPARSFLGDDAPQEPTNPTPPGIRFTLDDRGLVVPTPTGALSPDGVLVFLGRPAAVPPVIDRSALAPPVVVTQPQPELVAYRPKMRPNNLAETTERNNLGGLSRAELAGYRPRLRPETSKQAEEADETPTARAVAQSRRPSARPRNFDATVAVARAAQNERVVRPPEPRAVASVAPRTVTPSIPSRSSVTKSATVENAIKLNRINLMGVYGTASNRRALVRLSNGRYKKVKVGDRIDGGRVSAIGEGELRYRKGSRNVVLKMPKT